MSKVCKAGDKKEKVSLSLDPGLIARLRAAYPGVPLSRAASHAVQAHLERSELEKRVRNLEIVSRAALMLLADYVAGMDGAEGERLRWRYAQKALAVARKAEERAAGERVKEGAGEGASLPKQAEGG